MSTPSLLSGLQTEERNPRSANIDTVSTLELCHIINDEDANIPSIVRGCIAPIAGAIDCLTDRVRRGGRVIYVGAGTSGRLGVLDASEIPPTYSAPVEQFVGLIAGGDVALRSAREGAEDSAEGGVKDLEVVKIDGEQDSLIGIASSGRTPYVLGCLEFAKSKGCATVGIACTSPSALGQSGNVDFLIEALTGPEVVTGSTRMKAGTATKLILNMISSGIMIKLGKTYGNIMVDVKPTNIKLQHRARRIIREVVGSQCTASDDELDSVLAQCDRSVKLASVVLKFGISVDEARSRLDAVNGMLARVMDNTSEMTIETEHNDEDEDEDTPQVVICVDAGGSKCRATILHSSGHMGSGVAGSCNVSEVGSKHAAVEIKKAIERATKNSAATKHKSLSSLTVDSIWIGIAGGDRKGLTEELKTELSRLLPRTPTIRITNDLEMLASIASEDPGRKNLIILVVGTGSIAIGYRRHSDDSQFIQVARAGGWGPLLGDDGSGFDIGRQAIRYVLEQIDQDSRDTSTGPQNDEDPLRSKILDHYRPSNGNVDSDYDLLSTVLLGDPDDAQKPAGAKLRIASCARIVIRMAKESKVAAAILASAQQKACALVQTVLRKADMAVADTKLLIYGGVAASNNFSNGFWTILQSEGIMFRDNVTFNGSTYDGSIYLANRAWGGVEVIP